jgi:hypothetical protein
MSSSPVRISRNPRTDEVVAWAASARDRIERDAAKWNAARRRRLASVLRAK